MSEEKKDIKPEEGKKEDKKVEKKVKVDISDKEVVVEKGVLQGLISTVTKLEQEVSKMNGENPIDLPTTQIKKARVHFYKGEVVTKIGSAWEVPDRYGEGEMRLEIFIGDKMHEVKLKDFVESNERAGFTEKLCVIKEIKTIDEGVQILGWVDKIEVEYDSYRSKTIGKVPNKVVTPVYEYIMEIPKEGEEEPELVSVNPLALN